jgi:putative N6-adenine-specific DNA methylase
MHLCDYDAKVYHKEMAHLRQQIKPIAQAARIIATDYSNQAIANARMNAKAAGVERLIEFAECDFALTEVPEGAPGVFFINPEYGERLGDVSALE